MAGRKLGGLLVCEICPSFDIQIGGPSAQKRRRRRRLQAAAT